MLSASINIRRVPRDVVQPQQLARFLVPRFSITFSTGVSLQPGPIGVALLAQEVTAFFMRVSDPQLSVITRSPQANLASAVGDFGARFLRASFSGITLLRAAFPLRLQ